MAARGHRLSLPVHPAETSRICGRPLRLNRAPHRRSTAVGGAEALLQLALCVTLCREIATANCQGNSRSYEHSAEAAAHGVAQQRRVATMVLQHETESALKMPMGIVIWIVTPP
jgi:hypothetical protein